jgi:hypothetical protein
LPTIRLLPGPAKTENEFSTIAKASKLFRDAIAVMIRKAADGDLNNRLMSVFAKIKNLDGISSRGKRQVYIGLEAAEAKTLLKGFDLNGRSKLRSVLSAPYVLDPLTGGVTISDLIPAEMLHAPQHATNVSVQTAMLNLNFETTESAIAYSAAVNLPLNLIAATQTLIPVGVPAGTGPAFYFLLIEFFQEINGVQYPLNNGNFNALALLDVV